MTSLSFGATGTPFFPVFELGVFDGLPLHVFRPVFTAITQRLDMVYDVARTRTTGFSGGRTGVVSDELRTSRSAAFCGPYRHAEGEDQGEYQRAHHSSLIQITAPC